MTDHSQHSILHRNCSNQIDLPTLRNPNRVRRGTRATRKRAVSRRIRNVRTMIRRVDVDTVPARWENDGGPNASRAWLLRELSSVVAVTGRAGAT